MGAPIGVLIDTKLSVWLNAKRERHTPQLPWPNQRMSSGLKSLQKLVLSRRGDVLCAEGRIINFFAPNLKSLTLSEGTSSSFKLTAKLAAAAPIVTHLTIGAEISCPRELTEEIDISHPRLIHLDFTITESSPYDDDPEHISRSVIFNGLPSKSLSHLREATFRCPASVDAFWKVALEPPIKPLPVVRTVHLHQYWGVSDCIRELPADIEEFLSSFPNTEILEYCIDWWCDSNRSPEKQLMRSWIYSTGVGGFCAWSISHDPTLKKLRSFSVLDATIDIKPFLSSFTDELPLYAYCHATEPCYNLDEIVCVEGREAMEYHFTFEQISCSVIGSCLSQMQNKAISLTWCVPTHYLVNVIDSADACV
jgi:hypothetical protein